MGLNDPPYAETVRIDIHKPLAVRGATRKRRIPRRFRNESDLAFFAFFASFANPHRSGQA